MIIRLALAPQTHHPVNHHFANYQNHRFLCNLHLLSAGVVGSPKLLLLSGIGPRQDLARLGIPLVSFIIIILTLKTLRNILLNAYPQILIFISIFPGEFRSSYQIWLGGRPSCWSEHAEPCRHRRGEDIILDSGILKRWNSFESQTFNQIWNSYQRLWKFWRCFVKSSTISSCKQRGLWPVALFFRRCSPLRRKCPSTRWDFLQTPSTCSHTSEGKVSFDQSIVLKIFISEKSFESNFDQDPLPLYRVLKEWRYTGEISVFEDDHDQSIL